MGDEGNSYITQKRTEANKKRYCEYYLSRRNVKYMATGHLGDEEEEFKEPSKKPNSEKGVRNVNSFGRANNDKLI